MSCHFDQFYTVFLDGRIIDHNSGLVPLCTCDQLIDLYVPVLWRHQLTDGQEAWLSRWAKVKLKLQRHPLQWPEWHRRCWRRSAESPETNIDDNHRW